MESGKYEGVWTCCITRRDNSLKLDKMFTLLEMCHRCELRERPKTLRVHNMYAGSISKLRGMEKGKERRGNNIDECGERGCPT
jgi:hypothetical protein